MVQRSRGRDLTRPRAEGPANFWTIQKRAINKILLFYLIEDAMRRDTAAPCFWMVPFCGLRLFRLTAFCGLQFRGWCLEEFVCVPGSLLVLGGFVADLCRS